uniref:Uncharacterized protein n=1 Tax=Oryza punctata TaxID=4537 RepID=A0A0E0M6F4_ORYPU
MLAGSLTEAFSVVVGRPPYLPVELLPSSVGRFIGRVSWAAKASPPRSGLSLTRSGDETSRWRGGGGLRQCRVIFLEAGRATTLWGAPPLLLQGGGGGRSTREDSCFQGNGVPYSGYPRWDSTRRSAGDVAEVARVSARESGGRVEGAGDAAMW